MCAAEAQLRPFRHEALFYAGPADFLQGVVPFVTGALHAREPVLVAVAPANAELLRGALGDDGRGVHFLDMRALGANPARIIPAWRRFLAEHAADGRPARGIGEPVWPGRTAAELSECRSHEQLLNVAFDGGRRWWLLCPYDVEGLDRKSLAAARRSHPFLMQRGASRASDAYERSPESPLIGALPAPAGRPVEMAFTLARLGALRARVARWASTLPADRRGDLVLAVNELATNSISYGGGRGTLRMWRERGELLCEVRDRGHIRDPLVGRVEPAPEQPSGRGLWLVNQLCDLVQIRSSPRGSVVRVHMRADR